MKIKDIYLYIFTISFWFYTLDGGNRIYLSLILAVFFLSSIPKLKIFITDKLSIWFGIYSILFLIRYILFRDVTVTNLITNMAGIYLMFIPAQIINYNFKFNSKSLIKGFRLLVDVSFILITSSVLLAKYFDYGYVYYNDGEVARSFGFIPDSASPILVFLSFYFYTQKKWLKFSLSLLLLYFMQAKASSVLLFFTIFSYNFYINSRQKRKIKFFYYLLFFFFLLNYFNSSYNYLIENLYNYELSLNNRLLMYQSGFELFQSHFFTGLNELDVENKLKYLMYRNSFDGNYFESSRIYNPFLNSAVSLGIMGLISFCFIFYYLIKIPFRNLKQIDLRDNSHCNQIKIVISIFLVNYLLIYQGVNWFYKGELQLMFLLILYSLLRSLNKTKYD